MSGIPGIDISKQGLIARGEKQTVLTDLSGNFVRFVRVFKTNSYVHNGYISDRGVQYFED